MFYDMVVKDIFDNEVKLSEYSNKVVLIVNTASKWGFTPQFEGLEKLHNKYKDKGLVLLGFPCNQFLFQDPKSNEEINEFCQINYGVTFKMFSKIKVNGPKASELYKYLLENQPESNPKKIKWNFTKFLLNRDGEIDKRFESAVKPVDLEKDIERLL